MYCELSGDHQCCECGRRAVALLELINGSLIDDRISGDGGPKIYLCENHQVSKCSDGDIQPTNCHHIRIHWFNDDKKYAIFYLNES